LNSNKLFPLVALLFGASLWGIIWYPYRLLQQAGVQGVLATFACYLLAVAMASLMFARAWREFAGAPVVLSLLALSSGWCNLSYVLGVLHGEVMRVLLLFYLAPLWTVPLARFVLKERIGRAGYAVIGMALGGAVVMLWKPALGLPLPTSYAEWLGLSSGLSFAVANVLVRRATGCSVAAKALSVLGGVALVSLVVLLLSEVELTQGTLAVAAAWPLIVGNALVLVAMALLVQYGLTHTPATQAIVIMLFELIVAAIAAYLLAGEVMGAQEWIGGVMIIIASLFSGHMDAESAVNKQSPAAI
jgi:drug/metabolite transporter (DMT)-like permease